VIACSRCGHPNDLNARFCSNCGAALGAVHVTTETRKVVTVLFADVVGSTNVGERTDPEALRRVMTRYFDEMKAVIERHGGVVEKFIGDAVMAVFGVPVAHEDDALRAVRAAAEIRTHLTAIDMDLQRERGISVAWRTGINTGEVVAGDAGTGQRFVSGDAVNVAARLEQAAGGGEILIGPETFQLVRHAARTELVGEIAFKGRTAPIVGHRLLDVAAASSDRVGRLEAPMVGRQRPRRLLADAYEQVVGERVCHVFTILGLAGVGKSRLVREFLSDVGDRALVLRGRCLSYGEGITYWPISEVIREAAGLRETDHDEAVTEKLGRLVGDENDRSQVVPRLGELIGRFAGAASQEETFWAVRTMLESLARRRPVVLVLDDLHWAEPTLLDLVDHLADWIREAPLLVICLARRELLESRPGWGGGKAYATTLTLEPLNDAESHELVAALLGDIGFAPALEERITGAAEGNPLFVEEMVGMLIDGGQVARRDGGWEATGALADVAVPRTIQALLAARLDGLPGGERAVLERAAVEGKVFHRGAVAELTADSLREAVSLQLRSLMRKELLRPEKPDFAGDEAFRFRHLLIRDAAYSAMPKEMRSQLHARFAAWLARMAADHVAEYEEILGYHYEQAYRYRTELGPADDEAHRLASLAARHLGASGRRAIDRGDATGARKLLTRAVELVAEDDSGRHRLRAELGQALWMAGELREADEVLRATIADALTSGDELGAAYAEVIRLDALGSLGEASVEQLLSRSDELQHLFETHADERGADRATDQLARQHFFAGRARRAEGVLAARIDNPRSKLREIAEWLPVLLVWGPTPVPEATQRVAAYLASPPSRSAQAMGLTSIGLLHAMAGDFEIAREQAQRGIDLRYELGMRVVALSSLGNFLGSIEILAGNYDQAERILTEAYVGLAEAGERGFASTVVGLLADVHIQLGRWDDAEREALLAREMAPTDDVDAQARGMRAQARVLAHRGETSKALGLVREAVAMVEPTDYLELRGETYADLAEVLSAAGDTDGAASALRESLRNYEEKQAAAPAARIGARLDQLGADL
jgi:class 3 adenylate cyclase/tetratricopeptide (TPR) repeat protein